jgi:NADPH:quinone reductase-like Zn-dependent oxidoreductase
MRAAQDDVAAGDVGGEVPADGAMQAIVQDGYGDVEVLRSARIAVPKIAAGEVLLRVHAAGLDRGTWHVMAGQPLALRLAFGLRAPRNPVLGRDVAGTVVAVGASVTRFAVGDEVYGIAKGSFAEYAAAPEGKLAAKPSGLSFEQAAVVPVSAMTALQALTDVGRVERGQQVLVVGASGGVGSYAVQIAKALGAQVTGVCSSAKLELVRSLGADHVIDYATDDFAAADARYDLVLDIAGNPSLSRLRRVLNPHGTAVIVGGESGDRFTGGMGRQLRARVLSLFVGQRLTGLLAKERARDLERLTELVGEGGVTPSIDRTYPLAEAPQAMRHLVAGQVRGKVAIRVC